MNISKLQKLVSECKLTKVQIAEKCGFTRVTLDNVLQGADVKISTIEALAKVLGISVASLFEDDQVNNGITVDNINHSTSNEENDSNYMYVETRPRLPIAAALGNISDYYKGNKKNECDPKPIVKQFSKYNFTMLVNTDCMSPYINTGDVIACAEIGETIDYGHVYVVDTDGGALIKRVYQVQGNDSVLYLVSENPTYPDFILDKQKIIGMYRVVGLLRVGI